MEYDDDFPTPRVIRREAWSDSLVVEVVATAVDRGHADSSNTSTDGWVGDGVLINVSLTNHGTAALEDLTISGWIDYLGNMSATVNGNLGILTSTRLQGDRLCAYGTAAPTPGHGLNRASFRKKQAQGIAVAATTSGCGHVANGITRGVVPSFRATLDDGAPSWARSVGFNSPYPGQEEVPAGVNGPLVYTLTIPASATGPLYLGVGLSPTVYPSADPSVRVAVTVDGVAVGEITAPEQPWEVQYFRLNRSTPVQPTLTVTFGGATSPPPLIAALWVYSVNQSAGMASQTQESPDSNVFGAPPPAPHECSTATGRDSSGSLCPTLRPCSTTALSQQFSRGVGDPGQRRDLSFVDPQSQLRRWLNIQLYSADTCATDNGPLIVFRTYVCPTWCDCRNQFWNATTQGQLVNELSGQCITAGPHFASMTPCVTSTSSENAVASQKWTLRDNPSTGTFQIESVGQPGQCIDGGNYPAPPNPPPPDLGQVLAFVDVGASGDVPADLPHLALTVPPLGPGQTAQVQFFVSSSSPTASCPPAASLESLAAATDAAWQARNITLPMSTWSPQLDRALQITIQTLWMMTELQPDGLRVTKVSSLFHVARHPVLLKSTPPL